MAYDRIIAPTVYRHPIDQILCSLKYAGRLQWARTAAGLIVDCVLQQDLDLPQLLLPVPMTRKAVRRRGFNQSAYIARLVGRQLKIKVGVDVVTSCNTVAELVKVLKSGGAVVVDVWACARTPV